MNRIGFIVGIIICLNLKVFSQLPVAFEDIRYNIEDTSRWNIIQNLIKMEQFDSVIYEAYNYADDCLLNHKTQEFLFVINQAAANLTVLGKNAEEAKKMLNYAKLKLADNSDTINVEYAMLMKYIATHHFYKYEDTQALNHYLRGLRVSEKLSNDTILNTDFLMNVGNMYVNLGQFDKAILYLDKALQRAIDFNIPAVFMLTSQSYGYIASTRDMNLAIAFYEKIERVAVQLETEINHYNKYLANICNTLSAMYRQTGKDKRAIEYENKAYQYISQSNINDIYLRLSIFEKLFASKMDYESIDEQEKLKNDATDFISQNQLYDKPVSVPILSYLIYFYHSYDMVDSVDIIKKQVDYILNNNDVDPAAAAFYYSIVQKTETRNDAQEKSLYESIKSFIPEFSPDDEHLDSLILALVYPKDFYEYLLPNLELLCDNYLNLAKETGEEIYKTRSLNILRSLVSSIETHAKAVVEKNTGNTYSREFEDVGTRFIELLYDMYKTSGNENYLYEFLNVESRIKAFFLNQQMQQKELVYIENSGDLKKEYLNLLMQKNEAEVKLQEVILSTNSKDSLMLKDSILSIDFQLIRYQIKLEKEIREKDDNSRINFEKAITNSLKKDEAIISYYLHDSCLYTSFISLAHKTIYKTILPDNFYKLIKQANRSIKSGSRLSNEVNQALYSILFGSFNDLLSDIHHLNFIPHKELTGIPFEVFVNNNNEYLIQNYSISYHSSLSLLIKGRKKESQNIENLSLFAPVFTNKLSKDNADLHRNLAATPFSEVYNNSRQAMRNLYFSREEVKQISKLSNKNNVNTLAYVGGFATESNFKINIENAQIIHIATHGYVNKKYPELTGLFFAENRPSDDGFLFVDEIMNLSFNPSLDLVVLSSCNSGAGILEGSEGINSLQRHFIKVGVPNVIASLWKVHDEKTKDLMVAFYKHLLEDKVSYAEALRLAKLDCIKKGFLPLDWAGFVLIGN